MSDTELGSNEPESPKKRLLRRFRDSKFYCHGRTVSIVIIVLVVITMLIISRDNTQVDEVRIFQVQHDKEFGYSTLEPEEIEHLIKNDSTILSLPEAEKLIMEYSKSFTTTAQVESLLRRVVSIECDVDGEMHGGSGVIMRGQKSEDSTEWFVYTTAHIMGTDSEKIRMCRVFTPHTVGGEILDNEAVDIFEATVVRIAEGYPDVDFAELRIIEPKNISDISIRRCSSAENVFADKVLIFGVSLGLVISNGIINNFPAIGETVETLASAYPGTSGGMGFNLSKDCSIGVVSWADEETFAGLIQTWEVVGFNNQ